MVPKISLKILEKCYWFFTTLVYQRYVFSEFSHDNLRTLYCA